MKQVLILIILSLAVVSNLHCQKKQEIYKPKLEKFKKSDLLEGKNICLIFKDGREIHPKSKPECTFEDLAKSIHASLSEIYPDATFTICDSITSQPVVEIRLDSYGVSFHTGTWRAVTSYYVKIKSEGKSVKSDISQAGQQANVWGKKSAKKALNQCFYDSIVRLSSYISDNLE